MLATVGIHASFQHLVTLQHVSSTDTEAGNAYAVLLVQHIRSTRQTD